MNDDDWIIGSLAQQQLYRPLGNDPWTNTMPDSRAAAQAASDARVSNWQRFTVPDTGMNFGTMSPGEEAVALPQRDQAPERPLDAALLAARGGPVGMGSIVAGALLTATPAEGAKGPKIPKAPPPRGILTEADFPPVAAAPDRLGIGGNKPPAAFRTFPEYADVYPPVGPPAGPFVNAEKEAAYLKKGMTPEEARSKAQFYEKQYSPQETEFQKVRDKVRKDMQKNGYIPFFDPSQRFHVDPANYPPNADTLDVTDKVRATNQPKIDTPEARAALQAGFEKGKTMPNTQDWYAMGQLEKAFIDELGEEAGRKAFQDRFATSMATTTGGADPTNNFLAAMYGNYLRENNLPLPGVANQHPHPVGGRFIQGNLDMQREIPEFAGLTGGDYPKRHNFSQNFTGNQGVGTIDEQMMGAFTGHWKKPLTMPAPGHYGIYEQVLRDEAAKAGMTPQEYQAITWSGLKSMKDPKYTSGKSMIEHVNDSIERTARLTGLSREDVVKQGIIRSKIPLYALAGGMAMPAISDLARQDNYQ